MRTYKVLAIVVTILVAMSMLTGLAMAQEAGKYDEFTFSAYSDVYRRNEERVYNSPGANPWRIPAGGTESFNSHFSGKDNFANYEVAGVTGGGVCDTASRFAQVAIDFGLTIRQSSPGHVTPVAGVSALNLTTIWDPGTDLWISNPTDHDLFIHWEIMGTSSVRMWVDENSALTNSEGMEIRAGDALRPTAGNGEIVVNTIDPKTGQWTAGHPPEATPQVPWIPILGAIGGLLVVGSVISRKFRRAVGMVAGETVYQILRPKSINLMEMLRRAAREAMSWWLVLIVVVAGATPMFLDFIREGFTSWIKKTTTVSNQFIAILAVAILINWVRRSASRGFESHGGRVRNTPFLLSLIAFPFKHALRWFFYNLLTAAIFGIFLYFASTSVVQGLFDFLPPVIWQATGWERPSIGAFQNTRDALQRFFNGIEIEVKTTSQVVFKFIGPVQDSLQPAPQIQETINSLKKQGIVGTAMAAVVDAGSRTATALTLAKAACDLEGNGCDPALLTANWSTETKITDCSKEGGQLTATVGPGSCLSNMGAKGPFQFMDDTWIIYAEPGWDRYDFMDAARAAWRMMLALKIPSQPDRGSFVTRYSGADGGLVWNYSAKQAGQVWDMWQSLKSQ